MARKALDPGHVRLNARIRRLWHRCDRRWFRQMTTRWLIDRGRVRL